ncbi:hypothetical protein K450DRAFT_235482 [Umbelopsis ramanniana AG]|uniref:histidine kinase n=1 Tax=Umbelopsis ramanniana AG TaxID=1314678 RepID=A0AAD5HDX8_UMBRA|nr:uncharacterized protein K450DRAFT_235482 [Umbelopsis ramanniana AG]KAI8580682.1 hypothetical protein K450DRAFT_235482 [Umbelopsis ramanniana AG]
MVVPLDACTSLKSSYQLDQIDYHDELAPVAIASGYRLSDKQPVIVKLSTYANKLENEYQITTRLSASKVDGQYLVKPIELISEEITALVFEDDGYKVYDGKLLSLGSTPYARYQTIRNFLKLAVQICECLGHIHSHKVVHAGIRPSSFLYQPDSKNIRKIWDFETSSRAPESIISIMDRMHMRKQFSQTMSNEQLAYLAPEQTGQTAYQVDNRTDLYSLGITFFFMLSQGLPFMDQDPRIILRNILTKPLPLTEELKATYPPIIWAIVEKLTSKYPHDRYQYVTSLHADLVRLQAVEGEAALRDINFELGVDNNSFSFEMSNKTVGRTAELHTISNAIRAAADRRNSSNQSSPPTIVSDGSRSYFANVIDEYEDLQELQEIDSDDEEATQKAEARNATVIAIHGDEGIGKTKITLCGQEYARRHGYVATASLNSLQVSPYHYVLLSLKHLLRRVLSESDEEIELFKSILDHCLRKSGFRDIRGLPAEVLDQLEDIGEFFNYRDEPLRTGFHHVATFFETKTLYHRAISSIFRALTTFRLCTIIFDDLHHTDESSLELLNTIATTNRRLVLVFTYRTDEITPALQLFAQYFNKSLVDIKLPPLEYSDIVTLIAASFNRKEFTDRADLLPMVDLIYRDSLGNAYKISQLLKSLASRNIIYYDVDEQYWDYDFEELRAATTVNQDSDEPVSDTDYIASQIESMPVEGQELLKWASLMGMNFSFQTVSQLMAADDYKHNLDGTSLELCDSDDEESSTDSMSKSSLGLQHALEHGFIHASGLDDYTFAHKRYLRAAATMIDEEQKANMRSKIAQRYATESSLDVFWVANHLLGAFRIISKLEKKAIYRKILVQAMDKANANGVQDMALKYCKSARALLAPSPWVDGEDSSYDETLHIYHNLSQLHCFFAHQADSRAAADEIIYKARNGIDRSRAYKVIYLHLYASKKYEESIKLLEISIDDLGLITVARQAQKEQVDKSYNRLEHEISAIGMDNILSIEPSQDPILHATMVNMEQLCISLFWKGEHTSLFANTITIIEASLKHGLSVASGTAFTILAPFIATRYGKYQFGCDIAQLGLQISEKYGNHSQKARTAFYYYTFMSTFNNHIEKDIAPLRAAYDNAVLSGDAMFARYIPVRIAVAMYFSGMPLDQVMKEAWDSSVKIRNWTTSTESYNLIKAVKRNILALQGKTYGTAEGIFDDDEYNDNDFIEESFPTGEQSDAVMNWHYSYKIMCLYMFGHDDFAIELAFKCFNILDSQPCHRHTRWMLFYFSLSLIRKLHQKTVADDVRVRYMEQIRVNKSLIEEWSQISPINYQMYVIALDAELASLDNQLHISQKHYEKALKLARAGGWNVEIALFYELLGEHHIRQDNTFVAEAMLQKALSAYSAHGSYGKARQLRGYHKDLELIDSLPIEVSVQTEFARVDINVERSSAKESTESFQYGETDENLMSLEIADLASILKSGQIISSEMNFDLLMKQMLEVILESSGADSGVIIVKDGTELNIVGKGSKTSGCRYLSPPERLESSIDHVLVRIALHTMQVSEPTIVTDSMTRTTFLDEYCSIKSAICTPILYKGVLIGCVFIETYQKYLSGRQVRSLQALTRQIGISVTNARLFNSLQGAMKDNAKMIERQQIALRDAKESREAAIKANRAKSNFLATISHELRTPFAGFYGMISLLTETDLDDEQLDIVETAKESCQMLLKIIDDLLDFSKLEAHKALLDLGPTSVPDVIADAIDVMASLAIQNNVNVTYSVDHQVPSTVLADAARLRQIFLNLIGNAIKFTKNGDVQVNCQLDSRDTHQDGVYATLRFEVIDTGIGIAPEQQKGLFEPFAQVDGSTTRLYGGTGLGLSICLQLIQLMSGSIGVISEGKSKGSTFWFTVQVKCVYPTQLTRSNSHLKKLSSNKILLATTHLPTAKMVQSMTPDLTITVKELTNDLFSDCHSIDLLIIDLPLIQQPGLCEELQSLIKTKKLTCETIVLYHSSVDWHRRLLGDENYWKEYTPSARITKPLRREVFTKALLEILSVPISQREVKEETKPNPSSGSRNKTFWTVKEEVWISTHNNVLIAEDNPVAQKLLVRQLQKLGFAVESVKDGEEAINIFTSSKRDHFSFAIFDHHMPKCDGPEAAARIRHIEATDNLNRMPIFALTADVRAIARKASEQNGMEDYLTKPLIMERLVAAIRNHCMHSSTATL